MRRRKKSIQMHQSASQPRFTPFRKADQDGEKDKKGTNLASQGNRQ